MTEVLITFSLDNIFVHEFGIAVSALVSTCMSNNNCSYSISGSINFPFKTGAYVMMSWHLLVFNAVSLTMQILAKHELKTQNSTHACCFVIKKLPKTLNQAKEYDENCVFIQLYNCLLTHI